MGGFDVSGSGLLVEGGGAPAGTTQTPDYVEQKGRIWWPMDEGSGNTIYDNLNNYDGTLQGPTWLSDPSWYEGHALTADDSNDEYVGTGTWGNWASNHLGTGDWAVTATVATDGGNATKDGPISIDNTSGSERMYLGATTGDVIFEYRDSDGNSGSVSSGFGLTQGQKHRIVWTGTGSTTCEIWVDGDQKTSIGYAGGYNDWDQAVPLFAYHDGGSGDYTQFWGGELDNIVVCDSGLTSTEIQEDYDWQPWT